MSSGIEVIQNVRVFGVECEGDELRVDLYGGDSCACGTLIYRFRDRGERRKRAALLRRWCDSSTPLTYVSRDDTATLLDELALLSDAMEG
ncbi:MAG: hypothetical protein ABIW46_06005 [Acidimicrobiales bacterium]